MVKCYLITILGSSAPFFEGTGKVQSWITTPFEFFWDPPQTVIAMMEVQRKTRIFREIPFQIIDSPYIFGYIKMFVNVPAVCTTCRHKLNLIFPLSDFDEVNMVHFPINTFYFLV